MHERTDILLTAPSAYIAPLFINNNVLNISSHVQRSPPLKVDAVVNNSLNVFGSVDVFMHTLDLNTRVKRFLHIGVASLKTNRPMGS